MLLLRLLLVRLVLLVLCLAGLAYLLVLLSSHSGRAVYLCTDRTHVWALRVAVIIVARHMILHDADDFEISLELALLHLNSKKRDGLATTKGKERKKE